MWRQRYHRIATERRRESVSVGLRFIANRAGCVQSYLSPSPYFSLICFYLGGKIEREFS